MFRNSNSLSIVLAIIIASLSLSSCKVLPPTIKSLDNVKVERSGSTGFVVRTQAVIHNPNLVRIRIKDLNLNFQLNRKTIATLGKSEDILIKRKADFTVPVAIEVKSLENIFGDLETLWGMFKQKEAELIVKGNIKLRTFCFLRFDFTVQHDQKIAIPNFK